MDFGYTVTFCMTSEESLIIMKKLDAFEFNNYRREHFELEKQWAKTILDSPKNSAERRHAYATGYKEVYEFYTQYLDESSSGRQKARNRMKYLQATVRSNQSLKYLEVGFGEGDLLEHALKSGWDVHGVDVNNSPVEEARKKLESYDANPENIICGEIGDVPIFDFDLIFNSDLLEHIHPDSAIDFIQACYDRLKPGGILIISTPNSLTGPHDITQHFVTVGDPAQGFHLKEYNIGELDDLLTGTGFFTTSYLIPPSRFICPDKHDRRIYLKLKRYIEPVFGFMLNIVKPSYIRLAMATLSYHVIVGHK